MYQYVAKYGNGLALSVLYLEMQAPFGTWLGLGDGNLISNYRSSLHTYPEDIPTLLH